MKKLLVSLTLFGLIAGLSMPLIGMMGQFGRQAGRRALPATRRAMTSVGQKGVGQAGNVTYRWKKPQLALPEPKQSWLGNWGSRIKSSWTPTVPKPPTLAERGVERHLARQQFSRTPKQFNVSTQGEVLRGNMPVSLQRYRAAIQQHPSLAATGLLSAAGLGAAGAMYAKPGIYAEPKLVKTITDAAIQTDPQIEILAVEQEKNETPEVQDVLDIKPKENELFSEVIIDSLGSEQTIHKKPLHWIYRMIRWKSPENSIHTLHANLFEQEAESLDMMKESLDSNSKELDARLTDEYFNDNISPEQLEEARQSIRSLSDNLNLQSRALNHAANSSSFKQSVSQGRVEQILGLRNEFKNTYAQLKELSKLAPTTKSTMDELDRDFFVIDLNNKKQLQDTLKDFIPTTREQVPALSETSDSWKETIKRYIPKATATTKPELSLKKFQEVKKDYDIAQRGLATLLEESSTQGVHSLTLV